MLGSEHAKVPGAGQKVDEHGHRLHHLYAVRFLLETLVDLEEGHDPLVNQRLRGRLSTDLPVHRPLEQYGSDDLAAAERGRGDDPLAHLVDKAEHVLVVRPGPFLDSIAAKRLGR